MPASPTARIRHGCGTSSSSGGEGVVSSPRASAPQTFATARLVELGFAGAVADGAVVFAVCAGFQILGEAFTGNDGAQQPGLGLIECSTRPKGARQIGELVVEPSALDLPLLTGF